MIRKTILMSIAIIALVPFLAACDATAPAVQPTAIPTQTQPPPSPPTDTRIFYQYTGGIAGFNKELVIGPNGNARLSNKDGHAGRLNLGRARHAQLIKRFDDAHFFDLDERYEKNDRIVPDDIYLTIIFSQGERTKTVTVAQIGGQEVTPQPLKELIAELDKIVSETEATTTPTP